MKFFKCLNCGKIFILNELDNNVCCSNEFEELVPNSVEAAFEKHVPVCEIKNDKVIVQVGEVLHPMIEEHFIEFIVISNGKEFYRIDLKPGDKPEAIFNYICDAKVYAYCNIHGLWEISL